MAVSERIQTRTSMQMYVDGIQNFWMYARWLFNPDEVLIFTDEKNATRICEEYATLVHHGMLFRMAQQLFRPDHREGVKC